METLTTSEPAHHHDAFWERYKREVMAVLVIALLAVAAYGGYQLYSSRQANEAAAKLASAKTAAEYEKVIAEYPRASAAASAYLLLADAQRKEKKFSEANTTLETFLIKFPKHELTGTARLALAGNFEAMGKKDEALTAYQRLVAAEPQGFAAPIALYSQIHLFKEKKQIAEARKVCETLMTQYRESRLAPDAAYQLRLLKVDSPPAVAPTEPPQPGPVSAAPPAPQSSAAAPPAPQSAASPKP